MAEDKLPVNLGKTKRGHRRATPKPPTDIAPPASHAPGDTFHPGTKTEVVPPDPVVEDHQGPNMLDMPGRGGKLPIAHHASFGRKLLKELVWLVVLLLIVVAGGLAAIYFLKI